MSLIEACQALRADLIKRAGPDDRVDVDQSVWDDFLRELNHMERLCNTVPAADTVRIYDKCS